MRAKTTAFWILTVAAAFFVGRFLAEAPAARPLPITVYREALEEHNKVVQLGAAETDGGSKTPDRQVWSDMGIESAG